MQRSRKVSKIMHSLAACGLIGGLACYMLLLIVNVPETPTAYADLRRVIQTISDYVILPSLGLALVTGLLSMMVHYPFTEKSWVWLKAVSGVVMFEGTLTVISAKARYAAKKSAEIAAGDAPADALQGLLAQEWNTLAVITAIAVVNVIIGVWRPKRVFPDLSGVPRTATEPVKSKGVETRAEVKI